MVPRPLSELDLRGGGDCLTRGRAFWLSTYKKEKGALKERPSGEAQAGAGAHPKSLRLLELPIGNVKRHLDFSRSREGEGELRRGR